jgi:hypothetical protein
MRRTVVSAAAALIAVLVAHAGDAGARPGGGQSFSSSGSSRPSSFSSSGSSSWGSGRSSSGSSSWSSSGSSSWSSSGSRSGSGSLYGSNGPSSSGSYVGTSPGTSSAGYDGQMDGPQCTSDCAREGISRAMNVYGNADAGPFDEYACEEECRARMAAARRAAEASTSPSSPATYSSASSDPPLSRRFFPLSVLLGLVATGAGVSLALRHRRERQWATWAADVDERATSLEEERRYTSVTAALEAVGGADHGFSPILFGDFLYALYAEVHVARGGGHLARLGPYLGERARAALGGWPADAVDGIIVGAATVKDVHVDPSGRVLRATVDFEANYTERTGAGEQSYYARESWTLERATDAKSRPPDRARVIGCASCGAPLEKIAGGSCRHCGAPAAAAADWRVAEIHGQRDPRGPILTGTTQEQGTEDPTAVAPDAKQRWTELCQRDPAVTWASFCARIELVFRTFHRTWAAQDLADVRPLLSDMLFETQRYWVAAYQAQGLRNVTEEPVVVLVQLSKVTRDAYFDAVTVRVFATCKDYTVDRGGKVVGGSRDQERRYSEYWTFIRSANRVGAAKTDPGCPSCGAPLGTIGMAGTCSSCGAKVTSGEFDWVLSRIEQDEVYALA